ncbi:uncharacterized protein LOC143245119 isoform X2 [Tachypleus tridentatus]|uniref:uncharacterized protein LOC143245119 isoform X2 n=1 Tax=Tachypleus tridentatus TaxID=6853 RepID=UPI003FCF8948
MAAMVPVFMLGFVAFFLYVLFKFIHKKPTTQNDIKTSVSAVSHEECHADDTKSEIKDKKIDAKEQETLEKRQVPDTLEETPKEEEVQNDEDTVGQAVEKDVLTKVETSQTSGEIYGGEKESVEEQKMSEEIFEACVEPTDKHEPEKEPEKSNEVLSCDLKAEEIVTQDISETSDLKESERVIDSKEPFESSEQADNIHHTESLLSVPILETTSQASSDEQFSVLVKPGQVSAAKETSEYLMETPEESSKKLFDENVELKVESDIVSTTELLSSEEMLEVNSKSFSEEPGKLPTTEEPKECSDAIEITNGALRTQVEENVTFTQACDKVPESSVTEKYPDTVEKVFKDELSFLWNLI